MCSTGLGDDQVDDAWCSAWLPVKNERVLFDAIDNPVEIHVHCLWAALFASSVSNPNSHLLSEEDVDNPSPSWRLVRCMYIRHCKKGWDFSRCWKLHDLLESDAGDVVTAVERSWIGRIMRASEEENATFLWTCSWLGEIRDVAVDGKYHGAGQELDFRLRVSAGINKKQGKVAVVALLCASTRLPRGTNKVLSTAWA
jgi:hypothetical protein